MFSRYQKNIPDNVQDAVKRLKDQLQVKDAALTEIRLEALTSAHQLDSLKETISKLHSEMMILKADDHQSNDSSLDINSKVADNIVQEIQQLKSIVDKKEVTKDLREAGHETLNKILSRKVEDEGKKVKVVVLLGCHGDYDKYMGTSMQDSIIMTDCTIGEVCISGKTKWEHLDEMINHIFNDYLQKVDSESVLGLSIDSISSYHLGEVSRSKEPELPELLPCGYLIGDVNDIKIVLKGATINSLDALAFETLVPKSNLNRYISILIEHRRLILCGPSKTGKSYLARKLAEYLVSRLGIDPSSGNIATLRSVFIFL